MHVIFMILSYCYFNPILPMIITMHCGRPTLTPPKYIVGEWLILSSSYKISYYSNIIVLLLS